MQDKTSPDEHPLITQNKIVAFPGIELRSFLPRLNPKEMEQLGVYHLVDSKNHFGMMGIHQEYFPFMAEWYENKFLKYWIDEEKMEDDFSPRIWFEWYKEVYTKKGENINSIRAAWMIKFWKKALLGLTMLYKDEELLPQHAKQTFLELAWSWRYPLQPENFKIKEDA